MDAKKAIECGDAEALRRVLSEDASQANVLVRWGPEDRNLTHPLHYISDMLFDGALKRGLELPLVEALIQAGADVDFQRDGKGDTPLIGAASLAAEAVALRLLEAGAKPDLRGLFGETALHWAALLGEDRLAARLTDCCGVDLKDERYKSPPLGWAIHGCYNPPHGSQGRQRKVISILIAAGASVAPEWLDSAQVRNDPTMLAVLKGGRNDSPGQ